MQATIVFGAAVPFAKIIEELRSRPNGAAPSKAPLNMAAHLERIAGANSPFAFELVEIQCHHS